MSRKSNGLDNMVTERFFRHLKVERVNYRRYEIGSQDIADVIYYIGRLYNLKRRHYQLGSISPDEYECRLQQYAKLVSGFGEPLQFHPGDKSGYRVAAETVASTRS